MQGKHIEQFLNADEILKILLQQLPLSIFWKDKNGVYKGCNNSFANSLGFLKADDIIGKTDYDLPVDKTSSEKFIADDHQIMASGVAKVDIEEEQVLAEGKKVWLITNKIPLFNKFNEAIGVLGIYTNITELKQSEISLLETKKKLESANQAKSEFIANMSHDLRTPIAGMLGMVQDMMNEADQAKNSLNDKPSIQTVSILKNMIATVHRDGHYLMSATNELLQLCNEILEVMRLETAKVSSRASHFNLIKLIQHNIDLLQPTAQYKQLQLVTEIETNVPHSLYGAKGYLDRILLNLISNALKFTKKGFVKVGVKTIKEVEPKKQTNDRVTLVFSIEDSGIGIPQNQLDTIFEHFSRLTHAYEGLYTGSGLGLYTVKRYVAAMKGKVTLTSELGKGTCFIVTLPFIISDQVLSNKKETSSAQKENKKAPAIKILLVEDNEIIAIAMHAILHAFNCSLEVAKTGEQAVMMAQRHEYNLILMDIGLPDFNGIEATKKIRALPNKQKAHVPIVALTGHADNSDQRMRCFDAGMQEVLNKPAQRLNLESVLNRFVFKAIPAIEKTERDTDQLS